MSGWLADFVVVLHLLFIVFIAVGSLLALKWPSLVFVHVLVVAWAVAIVAIGFTCPLTPLEKFLRRQDGGIDYEGGFIDHYVRGVVYPRQHTTTARILVAVAIAAGYAVMWVRRRNSANRVRTR